jgi:hypothetical protein
MTAKHGSCRGTSRNREVPAPTMRGSLCRQTRLLAACVAAGSQFISDVFHRDGGDAKLGQIRPWSANPRLRSSCEPPEGIAIRERASFALPRSSTREQITRRSLIRSSARSWILSDESLARTRRVTGLKVARFSAGRPSHAGCGAHLRAAPVGDGARPPRAPRLRNSTPKKPVRD